MFVNLSSFIMDLYYYYYYYYYYYLNFSSNILGRSTILTLKSITSESECFT
jgi:hypothetical protein